MNFERPPKMLLIGCLSHGALDASLNGRVKNTVLHLEQPIIVLAFPLITQNPWLLSG